MKNTRNISSLNIERLGLECFSFQSGKMAKRFSPNDEEKTVRSAKIRASQIRQSQRIVCGIDVRTYVETLRRDFITEKKEKMQSFDYLRHRRPVSLESIVQKEIKRNHKRPKKHWRSIWPERRRKDAAHHTHKKGKWNINKCHNKRNLGNITREDKIHGSKDYIEWSKTI